MKSNVKWCVFGLTLVGALAAFSFAGLYNVYCYEQRTWVGGTGFPSLEKAQEDAREHTRLYTTPAAYHATSAYKCTEANRNCMKDLN